MNVYKTGVGVRIFPPGNPFPLEEIYGLYDSKSLPPRKDFLGKIFPPPRKSLPPIVQAILYKFLG